MKSLKMSCTLAACLLALVTAQGQIVAKSVCDQYPPSIVAKVYQFARQTKIGEGQQLKMAAFFQKADSLLVENIRQGKPAQEIDNANFTAYSKNYLNTCIERITAIKKVPESTLQKIRQQFYVKAEKDMYADWGSVLMAAIQTALPDTAIFAGLYNHLIKKQAVTLSATERLNLIKIHHVSKDEFVPIVKLVEQKAYQQALIEYTFAAYARKRDSLLLVVNKNCDSTIEVALLKNGALMNSSQFALALKFKQMLGIDTALADTLLFHALYLSRAKDSINQKDPFAKADFKAYEAKWMNRLLTEDQYTKLLSIKNAGQAKNDAENDWRSMEKLGVATGLDKKSTMEQLMRYYIMKWNAYSRYADDEVRQQANLQALKDHMPKAMKMLAAAKKQPNPVNANAGLDLKW